MLILAEGHQYNLDCQTCLSRNHLASFWFEFFLTFLALSSAAVLHCCQQYFSWPCLEVFYALGFVDLKSR